jgi:hypothetical protein
MFFVGVDSPSRDKCRLFINSQRVTDLPGQMAGEAGSVRQKRAVSTRKSALDRTRPANDGNLDLVGVVLQAQARARLHRRHCRLFLIGQVPLDAVIEPDGNAEVAVDPDHFCFEQFVALLELAWLFRAGGISRTCASHKQRY